MTEGDRLRWAFDLPPDREEVEENLSRQDEVKTELDTAIQRIEEYLDSRKPEYDREMDRFLDFAGTDFGGGDLAAELSIRLHAHQMEEMKAGIDAKFADYLKVKEILEEAPEENVAPAP